MLRHELSNPLYDALQGLPDPPEANVEDRGLDSATEAPCIQ